MQINFTAFFDHIYQGCRYFWPWLYSQSKLIQTPSTFHTLSQFIRYSLENGNKIWQELRVKLCQNKFILIMSDNFDRKVCDGLQSTKMIQLLNISTQLDETNYQAMLNLVHSVV